jgi:hypothetical protein
MNSRIFTGLVVALFFCANVAAAAGAPPGVKPGTWRGVLQRPDGYQVVFNFIAEKKNGNLQLHVINGEERLLVDSISQIGDSLFIQMPFFASGFRAKIKSDGNLEGVYIKRYAERNQVIPFFAEYGNEARYVRKARPLYDCRENGTSPFRVKVSWRLALSENSGRMQMERSPEASLHPRATIATSKG